MRYVILDELETTWPHRKMYLEETVHLWFLSNKLNNNVEFTSIPPISLDVIFIIGHNIDVYDYLHKHSSDIYESTIVLITCKQDIDFKSLIRRKNLYISNQSSLGTTNLLSGKQFSFKFDITESELLFYNCPEQNINKRIALCFTKL